MCVTQADHRLGQDAGCLDILHEGTGAHLHVEHQRLGALGDLLAHDRAGYQRDRLDRAGDVAQGVEQLVGGRQVVAGGAYDGSDVPQLGQELSVGQAGPPAGDRLQLVQRSAGVAEATTRQLGYRRTAGSHQGRQRQRDLVTDTTGRVLVHCRAVHSGQIHPYAGGDHGRCPPRQLTGMHAPQEECHEQGRHLLVRHLPPGVGVDDPVDLLVTEPGTVALGADHIDGVELTHLVRSAASKASGRISTIGRGPSVVSTSSAAPPCSQSS